MNKLFHKQQGVTFLGFLIVMAVIVSFILFGLRLFPLYNDKFKVLSIMKSIASQPNAQTLNQTDTWNMFIKNADIQGLLIFNQDQAVKDAVTLEKNEEGSGNVIHVYFEKRNKLFDDIDLILDFDESLPMGANE